MDLMPHIRVLCDLKVIELHSSDKEDPIFIANITNRMYVASSIGLTKFSEK